MAYINFRIVGDSRISKLPCNIYSIKRYLKAVNGKIGEKELNDSLFHLILCAGDRSSYYINDHFIWNGNNYYSKIEGWFE